MKLLDKLTEGAGIAMHYAAGLAAMWLGTVSTLISLAVWGLAGFGVSSGVFFTLFGLIPLGGGFWLVRRGKIQQQLFKVKLQKERVRELAYRHQGRLTPGELAEEQEWTDEQALNVLKNLAAEDPKRIELQLDYDSGEIYFEFPDIMKALEHRQQYQSLPITETLGRSAVEIAMVLGKTIDTFREYAQYTSQSASEQRKRTKEDKYRTKIERFLDEIDELKQQES